MVVAPVRFRLLVVLEFLSLVVLGLTLSLGLFFVDSSGDAFTVKRVRACACAYACLGRDASGLSLSVCLLPFGACSILRST